MNFGNCKKCTKNCPANVHINNMYLAIKRGDFDEAHDYADAAITICSDSADAYVGHMLAEYKVADLGELPYQDNDFTTYRCYAEAKRCATDELNEKLDTCARDFYIRHGAKCQTYGELALKELTEGKADRYNDCVNFYEEAVKTYEKIIPTTARMRDKATVEAATCRSMLAEGIPVSVYNAAVDYAEKKEYLKAAALFKLIPQYRDASELGKKYGDIAGKKLRAETKEALEEQYRVEKITQKYIAVLFILNLISLAIFAPICMWISSLRLSLFTIPLALAFSALSAAIYNQTHFVPYSKRASVVTRTLYVFVWTLYYVFILTAQIRAAGSFNLASILLIASAILIPIYCPSHLKSYTGKKMTKISNFIIDKFKFKEVKEARARTNNLFKQ